MNELTLQDFKDYLLNELSHAHKEYIDIKEKYNKAEHMDRVGMCIKLDKKEEHYYYLWMVCNDLGLIVHDKKEEIL